MLLVLLAGDAAVLEYATPGLFWQGALAGCGWGAAVRWLLEESVGE